MARTIVQKFKGTEKAIAQLKIEVPTDLKMRLDVVVAEAGVSLKDYVTQLVSRAVEAEERRKAKKEQVA